MMTAEQVRVALRGHNLKSVAQDAGVAYATLWRFLNQGSNPSYRTVELLSDYIEQRDAEVAQAGRAQNASAALAKCDHDASAAAARRGQRRSMPQAAPQHDVNMTSTRRQHNASGLEK